MLASESLPTHYNESIFKKHLKSVDKDLAGAAMMTAAKTEANQSLAASTASNSPSTAITAINGSCAGTFAGCGAGVECKASAMKTNLNNGTTTISINGSTNAVNGIEASNSSDSKMNALSSPHFVLGHPEPKFENFIRTCVDEIIKSAVFAGTNRASKVVEWHAPSELKQLFDFSLKAEPETNAKLIELVKATIHYSVKTGHPYFINQLYSGVDIYALVGQWVTDALNPSVYTYEVAPVFTLMEETVLAEMRRIVGFPNDGYGDGIFCPGGSIANGYGISCARYKYAPETKKCGLFGGKQLIIFTSEDAHYSVEKLAMFMGFGSENVCKIATNNLGKMDVGDLETKIQRYLSEDARPLMVSATAGTTVLGAFDDLNSIADICEKYSMWFHVDAAWGGGALVSKKYRHLLNGIERSDSVTWNPHKLLIASQQCSTFLTRHKDILSSCHSTNATYLFQKDKFYDTSYDTGDKHIQCGRRADVYKFWFMWKAKGTNGLEEHVNQAFKMSEYITELIKERPGFELVLEKPECTNVSFWYIPPSIRSMKRDATFNAKLHAVAPKVKEGMIKKGSMMITYQPIRQLPNFFRLVLQNSSLTEQDMKYFLDEIETLGCNL
ncbi:PREDICTED: cysteine sulfinic acid decarboxylase [Rhagoletis zephyria]|uniref:cysteine sulfinic acid decarboxylase n=1 Tax=Rhagoletis zephyria TaxID=28612 RepID=UPI00081158C4|nr:PREDICTED: cysteine sulfinic acid decarboxylase [Rhagoletis zephyria]